MGDLWLGLVDAQLVELRGSGYERVRLTEQLDATVWFPLATGAWAPCIGFGFWDRQRGGAPLATVRIFEPDAHFLNGDQPGVYVSRRWPELLAPLRPRAIARFIGPEADCG